ncbi:MAG: hypothetical protein CNIPEHKO_03520 [Anaerolineales bacterium]|nr:hypothetical protein [Anaerolineales bacterium]HQU38198.1 hypothetical protein [Anaerolineales bacterium]
MKKFYTDKDIEELFHNGVKSLQINDDVVLTDLAFEKARALGLLVDDSPPAAPVRPYLSDVKPRLSTGKSDSVSSASSQPALAPNPSPAGRGESSLEKRIREKVFAKLGNQVDAGLLDAIIKRALKATGMK